jgi:hypothetical protein
MDIHSGSLYRLEGWALEQGNYDLDSYRDRDQNWTRIAFEGMFLDPADNPCANQDFSLTDYVASIAHKAHSDKDIEAGAYYILFMIPQDCDEIVPAEDFPSQFDSYSAYPESDHKSRPARIFISRENRVTDLGRFKTLELLGESWDEAIERNANIFIPVNPLLSFCDSELKEDAENQVDTPASVISFVHSVASCLIDPATDRPKWFDELEQAAGAEVLKCAEQAGFTEIDILDLLYFVQESNEAASKLILNRLNTPVVPETILSSGLDTTQAQAFFKLLVEKGHKSGPHPEWYEDVCRSETAESLIGAAKKAGFNMTIEEFAEVVRAADGDEEEATADWIYMRDILG